MGFMTAVKANKAMRMQKNGNFEEAEKLYEEALSTAENTELALDWEGMKRQIKKAAEDVAPQEMRPGEEYPHWTMPEPTISDGYASELDGDFLPLGFAIPHVAPNDPCPCGSGLRYCRCHGKYLS